VADHPKGQSALGERGQHAAVERALDQLGQLGVDVGHGDHVRPRVVGDADDDVATEREVLERSGRHSRVESGDVGRGKQHRPDVAVERGLRGGQRARLERVPRRRGRRPAPRPGGELRPQLPRAVGAEQPVELRVLRRAERADDHRGGSGGRVSPRRNASPPARAPPPRTVPPP
jgi:hypothetical protein